MTAALDVTVVVFVSSLNGCRLNARREIPPIFLPKFCWAVSKNMKSLSISYLKFSPNKPVTRVRWTIDMSRWKVPIDIDSIATISAI